MAYLFNVTGCVLTDISLANGDELNSILPKFARPSYFFLIRRFCTSINKLNIVRRNKSLFFFFNLATFPLQNITGLDAGPDGKIQPAFNTDFSQSNSRIQ